MKLLKYFLFFPFLLFACAVGPSYQGSKAMVADPYKTTCTPFSFQPASIDTDSVKKVPGSCLGMDYLYEVQDKDKLFTCTGTTSSGASLAFAFDVLGTNPSKFEYRIVPLKPVSSVPVNGLIGTTTPDAPFLTGSTKGSQRVIVPVKAPASLVLFQIRAPVGLVLGPYCWQLPAQNVE